MIISIQQVVKRYADHLALNQIDLEIPRGKIFGLLGPNGAGKTSLIRIINQITAPDSGRVLFNEEELNPSHIERIGYLPEERGLYKKMKVGEQLLYLAQLKGMSKSHATEELKKWFIKFDIKDWWNKPVEDLSKGMQQKTQFISTIVHQPELLILDEPFSGFDPINANLLKEEILELKERGTTIIFSTHRMDSVEELCDNVALINHAEVVLKGEKHQIQNDFKKNEYLISFDGNLLNGDSYEIVKMNQNTANIRLKEESTVNQVLAEIMHQVDVKGFNEIIPGFDQIFIEVVSNSNS
ncbi:MAG: Fe(3+)-transporting ATPase [Bacteroidota bacterium]|jgi:ABC-2 type transport system ATP-binding protein